MKMLIALAFGVTSLALVQARDSEKVEKDQLPAPVSEMVMKKFPKGEFKSAKKEKGKSHTEYEVTLMLGDKSVDVNVHDHTMEADKHPEPHVFIHSFELTIPSDMVPATVMSYVKEKHSEAKMVKAEAVYVLHKAHNEHKAADKSEPAGKPVMDVKSIPEPVAYYEIDLEMGDKKKEIKVLATGKLLPDEMHDHKHESNEKSK